MLTVCGACCAYCVWSLLYLLCVEPIYCAYCVWSLLCLLCVEPTVLSVCGAYCAYCVWNLLCLLCVEPTVLSVCGAYCAYCVYVEPTVLTVCVVCCAYLVVRFHLVRELSQWALRTESFCPGSQRSQWCSPRSPAPALLQLSVKALQLEDTVQEGSLIPLCGISIVMYLGLRQQQLIQSHNSFPE